MCNCMGVILMLFGLVGLLLNLVVLATGRLWFVRSRRQAAGAAAASVATFVAGGMLLDSQVGSPGLGIAMMVGAGLLAIGAVHRTREESSIDSTARGALVAAAIIGVLGVGLYADTRNARPATPTPLPTPGVASPASPAESQQPSEASSSLGVSRADIQVSLYPAGFTFQKRADLYGQPHLQGIADTGASVSLIGPPDALTRIEFMFEVSDDEAVNNATVQHVAALFQIVLKNDAGPALEWLGRQLQSVEDASVTAQQTFAGIIVDFGADPDGYVRVFLYPE